ncbi:glucosamine-6-phosphate deaminase [Reichenbachiella faecimaris]|uniref:Glucosamine-6-phosphate deaminase n=1 Tax=Reichenbachiella faecimaris TaxID=692418 RepID=A0A1W2GBC8_REIFA|nr:glucosamine-6-phosphate deaminase [Reichenbachiella faecimaris]SMD33824.1 glucosamine-6-phosphate deaminase [Reichenbachiella faecimaris]
MVTEDINFKKEGIERIPVRVFESDVVASIAVAEQMASVIKEKQSQNKMAVLGLATGSSPIKVYRELVRMHQEDGLSFANVVSFNLDEYYPMRKTSDQSYYYFMHQHLFDHVDIKSENINIPDGELTIDAIDHYCRTYEQKIDELGGIDLQLLGIGRTGHIGFNEPGSYFESKTRLVKLDPLTIQDAASDFGREELVPTRAITMGIQSIFKAKKVILMAWGEKKAPIIKRTVEGIISEAVPATFLQKHLDVEVVVDENASLQLAKVKTPWISSICEWNEKLTKSAVIWLSQKLGLPILKLTDDQYRENGLGDLIAHYNGSQELNVKIFNALQKTITGWPGGKPGADDTNRPERALPEKKRVIVFSPHPDDDVISMGGTFLKLAEQGHEVHVAYQTSGNIAVFDDDARRFLDFYHDLSIELGLNEDEAEKIYQTALDSISNKGGETKDHEVVRKVKGLIRKGEAAAGARLVGLPDERIHFLNLPFYETGAVNKKDIGEADVAIITELLKKVKPHQVFAAGDLRDPHGTHKVCLDAIFKGLANVKSESWAKDCFLWLYRGAWQEWDVDEIQMAVPLSPMDLVKKRKAIFKHQSQKDTPVFPGEDKREFWQRAEDRNRETAKIYDSLGLAEYEAMEAFVKYDY